MKKLLSLCLAFSLCFTLTSCESLRKSAGLGDGTETPEQAVNIVMQAFFDFDKETTDAYLIYDEKLGKVSFWSTDDETNMNQYYRTYIPPYTAKQSFEILEWNDISENEKEAVILLTYYDISPPLIELVDNWADYIMTTSTPLEERMQPSDYCALHIADTFDNYDPMPQQTEVRLVAEQLNDAWYVQMPDDETRLTILGNMWAYHRHLIDMQQKYA